MPRGGDGAVVIGRILGGIRQRNKFFVLNLLVCK